ncbi:MAG TPA: uroporphyrinogen-III synthase [Longimicrobiales bacterium]|nr:uroporphyrinogen-III synthase [Longimicrobiales bacterium]
MATSEAQPLAGRCIAVTRARPQAREFGDRLTGLGAEVLYCAAIRISEPADAAPFKAAVSALDSYGWLVLTSTNGVTMFFEELARRGKGALPATLRVACVGPATAAALRGRGVEPDLLPAEYVGGELANTLGARLQPGARVLIARGAGGAAELPERLRAMGAHVDDVESYRSLPDLQNLAELRARLQHQAVDLIAFTSPSTVTYLAEGLGGLPDGVAFAAIGPVTAARLEELGAVPAVVAPEHSIPGLVQAITQHFASLSDPRKSTHG